MRGDERTRARQWLWFVLLWATGVAVFGSVMMVMRWVFAAITGG